MPMDPSRLQSTMYNSIYNGLKAQFTSSVSQASGYSAVADAQWQAIATAVSMIAADIVTEITTNAEVLPGQVVVTVGSPTTQTGATTTPGQIS